MNHWYISYQGVNLFPYKQLNFNIVDRQYSDKKLSIKAIDASIEEKKQEEDIENNGFMFCNFWIPPPEKNIQQTPPPQNIYNNAESFQESTDKIHQNSSIKKFPNTEINMPEINYPVEQLRQNVSESLFMMINDKVKKKKDKMAKNISKSDE